jgi:hypothetical protein
MLVFSVFDFLLLRLFLLFISLFFDFNSGVQFVGELHKGDDSLPFLLRVFVSDSLVLHLHVPALVSICGFSGVVLEELGPFSPRLEVVPVLVKFVYLFNRSGFISKVRYRLFLSESGIPHVHMLEDFVEILVGDVHAILVRNGVVEGEGGVIFLSPT